MTSRGLCPNGSYILVGGGSNKQVSYRGKCYVRREGRQRSDRRRASRQGSQGGAGCEDDTRTVLERHEGTVLEDTRVKSISARWMARAKPSDRSMLKAVRVAAGRE